MKAFFVILLAAMTAWVAVTANELDTAHKAVRRSVKSDNPAIEQFHAMVKEYGSRQVLLGIVGIVAGLILAFTIAMKLLKLIALSCVAVLAVALWQAWEHGYIDALF